jgi:hypothetical protein
LLLLLLLFYSAFLGAATSAALLLVFSAPVELHAVDACLARDSTPGAVQIEVHTTVHSSS